MSLQPTLLILGAGIVGCSTAYYAALRGWSVTVLEQSTAACAASGKAGGFLARSWGSAVTEELHHKGYDLHKELAQALQLASYREVSTVAVSRSARKAATSPLPWLTGSLAPHARTGALEGPTAQVTPRELTLALLQAAVARGTVVREGVSARGLQLDGSSGRVSGVRVRVGQGEGEGEGGEEVLPCTHVCICMGPWSGHAAGWVGQRPLPLEGVCSASLVYSAPQAPEWAAAFASAPPTALFCEDFGRGTHLEVYPRAAGELYVCGLGGSESVPQHALQPTGDRARAEQVAPLPARVAAGRAAVEDLLGAAVGEPSVVQACLRPLLRDALPVLSPLGREGSGVFIGAGHNCWGILWGPISGKVLVQLMAGEKTDVDLGAFSASRFA